MLERMEIRLASEKVRSILRLVIRIVSTIYAGIVMYLIATGHSSSILYITLFLIGISQLMVMPEDWDKKQIQ